MAGTPRLAALHASRGTRRAERLEAYHAFCMSMRLLKSERWITGLWLLNSQVEAAPGPWQGSKPALTYKLVITHIEGKEHGDCYSKPRHSSSRFVRQAQAVQQQAAAHAARDLPAPQARLRAQARQRKAPAARQR